MTDAPAVLLALFVSGVAELTAAASEYPPAAPGRVVCSVIGGAAVLAASGPARSHVTVLRVTEQLQPAPVTEPTEKAVGTVMTALTF